MFLIDAALTACVPDCTPLGGRETRTFEIGSFVTSAQPSLLLTNTCDKKSYTIIKKVQGKEKQVAGL